MMFIDGINTVIVDIKKEIGIGKDVCGFEYEFEFPFTDIITLMCLVTGDEETIKLNLN